MNSKKEITIRNRQYLKKYLNMSEKEWLDIFKNRIGRRSNKYGDDWTPENPTRGWCGGVTMALRLSGKFPPNFIACRNNTDPHYYLINPNNNEVIDLTNYQMEGDYEHDYSNYNKKFINVRAKDVSKLMDILNLEIDKSTFRIELKSNKEFIQKVK